MPFSRDDWKPPGMTLAQFALMAAALKRDQSGEVDELALWHSMWSFTQLAHARDEAAVARDYHAARVEEFERQLLEMENEFKRQAAAQGKPWPEAPSPGTSQEMPRQPTPSPSPPQDIPIPSPPQPEASTQKLGPSRLIDLLRHIPVPPDTVRVQDLISACWDDENPGIPQPDGLLTSPFAAKIRDRVRRVREAEWIEGVRHGVFQLTARGTDVRLEHFGSDAPTARPTDAPGVVEPEHSDPTEQHKAAKYDAKEVKHDAKLNRV